MRIRMSGRFIALTVLAALLLCLLPVVTPSAQARPINWGDPSDPNPEPGDNDGVVLKSPPTAAKAITTQSYGGASATSTRNVIAPNRWTMLRRLLETMRLNYWLFWPR
jgi:hypothetical protein